MFEYVKNALHHKIFVTVAFTDTGNVRSANVHSATLFGSFLTIIVCFIYLGFYGGGRELVADLQQLAQTKKELEELRQHEAYRNEQFKIIAQEMGVMQARLDRFDVIGERLFKDSDIGPQLQDVADANAQGGPEMDEIKEAPPLSVIQEQLGGLNERVEKTENTMLGGLELLIRKQKDNLMQPHLWPVVHERTRRTSDFGWRINPFNKKRKSWHGGIDIGGTWNAPIVASSDGIVVFSGYRHAYGMMVEVRHPGGFETRYGHMAKTLVKNGQRVKAGDIVGLMGSSGRSTGPHLHFEVLIDGSKVNPWPFVRDGINFARNQAKERDFGIAAVKTK